MVLFFNAELITVTRGQKLQVPPRSGEVDSILFNVSNKQLERSSFSVAEKMGEDWSVPACGKFPWEIVVLTIWLSGPKPYKKTSNKTQLWPTDCCYLNF